MEIRRLDLKDKLPLTCSRKGTCCHGNQVRLNPWEIKRMAYEKNLSVKDFVSLYCDFGGIQLNFNGEKDDRGKTACNLYVVNAGCSIHKERPLACRLFPIGRQIQQGKINYIFQGVRFPCLNGCPEVKNLEFLKVKDYLVQQSVKDFEIAQDEYLEVVQNLAEIAFTLLLDTNLAHIYQKKTLSEWRKIGNETPDLLLLRINTDWLEVLMFPDLAHGKDVLEFIQSHNEILQQMAQSKFEMLTTDQEFHDASCLLMAMTMYLAHGVGADTKSLSELWVSEAIVNGVLE